MTSEKQTSFYKEFQRKKKATRGAKKSNESKKSGRSFGTCAYY